MAIAMNAMKFSGRECNCAMTHHDLPKILPEMDRENPEPCLNMFGRRGLQLNA